MIYSEYKYIDVAFGGVNKRNNVVDVFNLKIPDEKDCYRTYFRFPVDYFNHYKKINSVSGYEGMCYADFIPLDIDDTDLNRSWEKTNIIINILNLDYDFEVRHIFFSGSKGFHIYLPSVCFDFVPSSNLNNIFKQIVTDICKGYVDIDFKNYDKNRLFRISNTINSKSGLYKIPITLNEFANGMDFITDLAKTKRKNIHCSISDDVKNIQFIELYKKYKNEKKQDKKTNDILTKIYSGVAEGERDDTAIKIVGILKKAGHDKEFARAILHGWNHANKPPLDEKEIEKCLQSGYKYKDDNQEDIEKYLKPIWAMGDEYVEYNLSKKKVNIGISFVDQKIRGLRPGQVMTIMGFTGNFKTGLLQWIMRHYQKYSNEPVLIFEMEMSCLDIFERAAQMCTGYSGNDIENLSKNDDFNDIIAAVKEDQKKFLVVDRPGLTFADMGNYLEIGKKVLKEKIELIGIDFLQLMRGTGLTNVQMIDNIAKGMKEFAKQYNVAVIALSQVTGVEDEYHKINLMDSRDSKTIGQMSDYVLGIYLKEETEDVQIVNILKNRKGGKCTGEIKIDRKCLKFEEIIKDVGF